MILWYGPFEKIVIKNAQDLNEKYDMLSHAFYAYWIVVRTSTRGIPYLLVYRIKVVMPLLIEIPSLKVLMETELKKYNDLKYNPSN